MGQSALAEIERDANFAERFIDERLGITPPTSADQLVEEFEAVLEESGLITWVGVVQEQKADERAAVHVYLSQRDNTSVVDDTGKPRLGDIIDAHTRLSLAAQDQFDVRMHFFPEAELPWESLRAKIEEECEAAGDAQLVSEVNF